MKIQDIKAREHTQGREIPAGWAVWKANVKSLVDQAEITLNFEVQAANAFEVSKYVTLISEHSGSSQLKSIIQKIK